MIEVSVKHNFETGHRLPHLPGKCTSLHGHSWWASITISGPDVDDEGVLVEFGALKAGLREWIDRNLDHGLMLGHADPLAPMLAPFGKVFIFGPELGNWPTVENVAKMLAEVAGNVLELHDLDGTVQRVQVTETSVNEATWTR